MGLLDDLRHKIEKLGDKAKEGLGGTLDKAGDLVGDADERDGEDGEDGDLDTDVGTLNPTDVPDDVESGPDADADTVSADDLDSEEASSEWEETTLAEDAGGAADADDGDTDAAARTVTDLDADDQVDDRPEPAVEADVDPFASPLTESIGDSIDADALAEVVEGASDDQDPQT